MATARQNRGAIAVLAILAATFCIAFLTRRGDVTAPPVIVDSTMTLPADTIVKASAPAAAKTDKPHRKTSNKTSNRKKAAKTKVPKYEPDRPSPLSAPVPR